MNGRASGFWLKGAETALAALALVLPLAFLLHSYDASTLKASLLQAGTLALLACWLMKGFERGRWDLPAQALPLLAPAVLLAAWTALRLASSPAPAAALPAALGQLIGPLLFCAAVLECGGARAAGRFGSWMLAAAWAAGAYALLQRLGVDPLPWKGAFGGRPFATLGSPETLGLFAAACAPLALARLADPERDGLMKGADVVLLLVLGAAAAGSPDGVLAFAAAGLSCAAALPLFLPSRSSLRLSIAALALTAAVVCAGPGEGRGPLKAQLWASARPLAMSRPLTGHGPGRAAFVLDESRSPALVRELGHDARPDRLPGMVLQAFCELGAVGAGLWLWLFGSVLAAAWRARRRFIQRGALRESSLLAGFSSGLTGLLVAGQWSLAAQEPAAGWLIWPLAGLCAGLTLLAGSGPVTVVALPFGAAGRRVAGAVCAAGTLSLLAFPARWQWADVTLNAAVAAAESGSYAEAARLAQAADVPGAPHALEAGYVAGQSLLAAGRAEDALSAFARLEERAPSFGQLQFVKGRAHVKLGQWELAARAFERQRELDPTFVRNLELLAAAAKERGDYPAARRAALAAIALEPDNPLPKVTLSQVYALERKAAERDEQRVKRGKEKRPKEG